MSTVSFVLNGQPQSFTPQEGETLLQALRRRFAIHSTKNGCAPQGQCGACLALIDGKPKTTCALPAAKVEGREVLTLEGVPESDRRLIARCFVVTAGLQCGFCIPGIALRAYHLVQQDLEPEREDIVKALDVHLCRCTGYVKILDAIELYARCKRDGVFPEYPDDGHVGASLARYEGEELTLGERPYVDDLDRPGLLYGAVVLSPHARARVKAIDTLAATAMEGVVKVATAEDVPGERWYGLLEQDWPGLVAVGEETRCVGDVLAVVAAGTEHQARAAAAAVRVEYEVLEPVLDPERALEAGAPQVNPKHPNLLGRTVIRRGDDVDAILETAPHVVSGRWTTQRIEHLFLEPESALAEPREDGGIHLYSQGQGVFDDRRQVAAFLGLAEEEIFVELVPNGGAFGGKEDMSVQAHAALLCHLTRQPVKLTLNREESIRMHPKRHPLTLDYDVACDEKGRLLAVRARILGDTGAYASVGAKVLERAAGHACGPYHVPSVDIESTAACTNNPPCGAMRGFGANQAHFAMEGCMDLLAQRVGLDPWEIRWINALEVGKSCTTGQVIEKSCGLKDTLEAVRPAYDAAREAGLAVGIACGMKNSGIGNGALEHGRCRLRVEEDGTVTVFNGFTEMGQGLLTVLVQCAVEVTGLPAETFTARVDSTYEVGVGQTTGSRGTLLGGRAVIDAAGKLKHDLDAGMTLDDLIGKEYAGEVLIDDTTSPDADTERIKTHTSYGFATQLCVLDEDGHLSEFVAAHDVGRALNPDLCEGQVEGSVHMGLGYALSEELPCPDGMPATFKLRELGPLRAADMPQVEVILVEDAEPEGPFGAKGVGEIGLVPTAAAVAGALEGFDGIRRTTLPMKDSPAARALRVGRIRGRV